MIVLGKTNLNVSSQAAAQNQAAIVLIFVPKGVL